MAEVLCEFACYCELVLLLRKGSIDTSLRTFWALDRYDSGLNVDLDALRYVQRLL
jgi:hypothetical protein